MSTPSDETATTFADLYSEALEAGRQFVQTKTYANLKKAVAAYTAAVNAAPAESEELFNALVDRGHIYYEGFFIFEVVSLLNKARKDFADAIIFGDRDDPEFCQAMDFYGYLADECYRISGNPEDLDLSISAFGEAIDLHHAGDERVFDTITNHLNVLMRRYDRDESVDDLNAAVDDVDHLLSLTKKTEPSYVSLSMLRTKLVFDRYAFTDDLEDIEYAITGFNKALTTYDLDIMELLETLSNYGVALFVRYKAKKNKADLDKAIATYKRRIQMAYDDDDELIDVLEMYAAMLETRHELTGSKADLKLADASRDQAEELFNRS